MDFGGNERVGVRNENNESHTIQRGMIFFQEIIIN